MDPLLREIIRKVQEGEYTDPKELQKDWAKVMVKDRELDYAADQEAEVTKFIHEPKLRISQSRLVEPQSKRETKARQVYERGKSAEDEPLRKQWRDFKRDQNNVYAWFESMMGRKGAQDLRSMDPGVMKRRESLAASDQANVESRRRRDLSAGQRTLEDAGGWGMAPGVAAGAYLTDKLGQWGIGAHDPSQYERKPGSMSAGDWVNIGLDVPGIGGLLKAPKYAKAALQGKSIIQQPTTALGKIFKSEILGTGWMAPGRKKAYAALRASADEAAEATKEALARNAPLLTRAEEQLVKAEAKLNRIITKAPLEGQLHTITKGKDAGEYVFQGGVWQKKFGGKLVGKAPEGALDDLAAVEGKYAGKALRRAERDVGRAQEAVDRYTGTAKSLGSPGGALGGRLATGEVAGEVAKKSLGRKLLGATGWGLGLGVPAAGAAAWYLGGDDTPLGEEGPTGKGKDDFPEHKGFPEGFKKPDELDGDDETSNTKIENEPGAGARPGGLEAFNQANFMADETLLRERGMMPPPTRGGVWLGGGPTASETILDRAGRPVRRSYNPLERASRMSVQAEIQRRASEERRLDNKYRILQKYVASRGGAPTLSDPVVELAETTAEVEKEAPVVPDPTNDFLWVHGEPPQGIPDLPSDLVYEEDDPNALPDLPDDL